MKPRIEWTDYSWNFITGCTQISPACDNCYAKAMTKRLQGMAKKEAHQPIICKYCHNQMSQRCDSKYHSNMYQCLCKKNNAIFKKLPKYYQGWDKVIFHKDALKEILDKKKYPSNSKIFVNSMSDTFHENASKIKNGVFCDNFWEIFRHTSQRDDLTFQFLTKRPKELFKRFEEVFNYLGNYYNDGDEYAQDYFGEELERHCWFGVTAENQKMADERIPILLNLREFFGKEIILFVSIEPMLDFMNIRRYLADWGLDWVIVGGENAPKNRTRKMDMYWVNSILEQCKEFNKPFFFKQRGNFYDFKNKENKLEDWEKKIINCKEFPKMQRIS